MNKAHGFTWYPFSLWFNLGWYPGDPFKLFDVTIGEIDRNFKSDEIDHLTLFSLQVIYFTFAFGWCKAG